MAIEHEIQAHDIPHLNDLTIDFVREYERLYYCRKKNRLPVCSVNIHIPSNIEGTGPSCYTWLPDGTVLWDAPPRRRCSARDHALQEKKVRSGRGGSLFCRTVSPRTRMVTVGDKTLKEDLRVGSAFLQYLGTFLYTRRFMGDQPSVHCA